VSVVGVVILVSVTVSVMLVVGWVVIMNALVDLVSDVGVYVSVVLTDSLVVLVAVVV